MKKLLFFILLPLVIFFSSCEKNEVVGTIPNRTIITDIPSTSWELSEDGRSYTTSISMPEIDNYISERGGVLVYLSFGDRVYEPIPQVYNGVAYRYDTAPGDIVLTVESATESGSITRPPSGTLKVILIESD